jgi:hypothetical protein
MELAPLQVGNGCGGAALGSVGGAPEAALPAPGGASGQAQDLALPRSASSTGPEALFDSRELGRHLRTWPEAGWPRGACALS